MQCRPNCGACCTAPSINSPIPGMPNGKPAGIKCIHLLADFRCGIFNEITRPAFCASLKPSLEMCGETRNDAIIWLTQLELATQPNL
ncbi:MAG: YkgJ family cysteine cluster protein [Pseudomonadota bacterium]